MPLVGDTSFTRVAVPVVDMALRYEELGEILSIALFREKAMSKQMVI